MSGDFRKKAEELLNKNPAEMPTLSTTDVQKLFHELNVHQIELQMQNEELRDAQHELASARDAYAELYDFAPVGYLIVDFESRIIDANFTAATMLGMERGKLLGKTFAIFVHPDALDAWDLHRRHILECQGAHGGAFILQRPDGASFTAQVECAPQPDAGHCLMTMTDIGKRVQAEEALRRSEHDLAVLNRELEQRVERRSASLRDSEERFRAIFERAGDGILVADPETKKFRMANQAICRMLDYSEEELLEMGMADIHPAEDLPNVLDAFEKQVRGERELAEDIPLKHRDGKVLYVDIKAFPIFLDGKHCLVGVVRDISERKEAEKKILFEQGLFQSLMDALPASVYFKDLDGRFIRTGRTIVLDPGLEDNETIIGKTDFDIFPEEDATKMRHDDEQVMQTRQPIQLEEQYGNQWLLTTKVPRYDENGVLAGIFGVSFDITERKKTDRDLRESEERFRDIFDQVPDGILMADPETRKFHMASQAFCTNMGYSEEQVLEMGSAGIHPAEDLPYVIDAFEKQARGEEEEVYDIPFLRSDGSIFYADMKAFRVLLDGKQYLLGHVRDVSVRKRMQDALQESEEKYRRLFETETDAIMIFDGETRRLIDVNNAAVELYGYSHEEFLQLKQDDITAEPEVSAASIRETLAGELTFIPMRRHRKKDGTVFPVEITACTFLLKDRRVVCGVLRDITERVSREEALRKLTTELSLAEQRERERIAKELHDSVSQLLSSSFLRLSALKESETLPDDAAESVGIICDILQDTLTQTRSLTFELTCPMLNELGLAAALEELCSSMTHEQSICFEFKGDTELLPLHMDRKIVIYRAARELLINVMKHSEAQWACVKLERLGNNARISVEDDGKGFDASLAGEGFSPTGGFGLFNIREYLRHAGGNLTIESIPGDGTEAVLTIPLEEADG